MCKLVHGHLCVAINSISHGLACLDLLPHIQDVPIGNTFQELGDFRSVSASHACTKSNRSSATGWGALMFCHLIRELKNHG